MGRKIAFALSLLVLIVTGVLGSYNGSKDAALRSALLASAMSALIAVGIVWTAKARSPARQPG